MNKILISVILVLVVIVGFSCKTPASYQLWLRDGYGGAQFLQGGGEKGASLCEGTETDGRIGSLPYAVGCKSVSWDYVLEKYPKQKKQILESKSYWTGKLK